MKGGENLMQKQEQKKPIVIHIIKRLLHIFLATLKYISDIMKALKAIIELFQ